MRHGTSNRRSRNRNNRRNNNNRSQVFDSNGPDVRIRGTAHQICEKYLALAKDATGSGDTVLAESYLQHAEHYQRMINLWNENVQDNSAESNTQGRANKDDDLSLPQSILGDQVDVKSEDGKGTGVRSKTQSKSEELEDA